MSILDRVLAFIKPQNTLEEAIRKAENTTYASLVYALKPRPEKRILYICCNEPAARQRAVEMGFPITVLFSWWGQSYVGSSFDEVIIDLDPEVLTVDQRYRDDWLIQCVRPRLTTHGRLRYLQ